MWGFRAVFHSSTRIGLLITLMLAYAEISFGQTPRLIIPATYIPSLPLPVVVEVELNGFVSTIHNGIDSLYWQDNDNSGTRGLELKHGRTSTKLNGNFSGDIDLEWMGETATIPAETGPTINHSGSVGANQIWQAGSVQHITGDVTIESGVTLTIDAGTWVVVDGLYNIMVDGNLQINGTDSQPVMMVGNGVVSTWGGIIVNGTIQANHVFVMSGGADGNLAYGHSNSQAVVKVENGTANLNRVYLLDNAGKGVGANGGSIEFTNGLIQRCDMGFR